MTRVELMLWCVELDRQLRRARALLEIGIDDPGFEFLEDEIYRFNQARLSRPAPSVEKGRQ
jgi:hypothetical protein